MLVKEILSSLISSFEIDPSAVDFDVAVATYIDPKFKRISFKTVDAYHWDEDHEFFLIPTGLSQDYFDIAPNISSAKDLLDSLHNLEMEEVLEYRSYVRDKVARLDDGSVVSLNLPLWGAGIQSKGRIVYFYYGEEPDNRADQ